MIIKVPVPVKEACVPKAFPHAPKYPDSDTALRDAGGAADRYQLMAAGRLLRDRRCQNKKSESAQNRRTIILHYGSPRLRLRKCTREL